jgi:glucose/arabinose dehydrogenase
MALARYPLQVRLLRVSLVVASVVVGSIAAPVLAGAATSPNLAAVHVKLTSFATGLDNPVVVTWRAGDNRAYVAQQTGKVVIVAGGHIVATALDLTSVISGGDERGLLGLTFTHDGKKMYVDYTDVHGDIRIVEYAVGSAGRADVGSRRPLLTIAHPNTNHNGGQVTIGPDNMLYIGVGDGGGGSPDPPGNGQNLTTLLGKILRIDTHPSAGRAYSIPPSNPFAGSTTKRNAIWMYGLRNPWRWSLDRTSHNMWIGDVGENTWEEIDFAPAGQKGVNWGWSKREGMHPFNGGAQPVGGRNPILERNHSNGDCAITGGYVYRGSVNPIPNLGGGYIFGDFCTGKLRAVAQQGGVVSQSKDLGLTVTHLTSFGEGPAGGIYAISQGGTIYKLEAA